jgi:hypothetical protein
MLQYPLVGMQKAGETRHGGRQTAKLQGVLVARPPCINHYQFLGGLAGGAAGGGGLVTP